MFDNENLRLEVLKDFFSRHQTLILVLVLSLSMIGIGISSWLHRQQKIAEHLSLSYSQILELRSNKKIQEAGLIAHQIIKTHPKSIYAALSALLLAKDAVMNKNYREAEKQLNFAIKNVKSYPELCELISLRLSRVLLEENRANDVLTLINSEKHRFFAANWLELEGDAYMQLEKLAEAEQSYRKAAELEKTDLDSSMLLHLKLQQF